MVFGKLGGLGSLGKAPSLGRRPALGMPGLQRGSMPGLQRSAIMPRLTSQTPRGGGYNDLLRTNILQGLKPR